MACSSAASGEESKPTPPAYMGSMQPASGRAAQSARIAPKNRRRPASNDHIDDPLRHENELLQGLAFHGAQDGILPQSLFSNRFLVRVMGDKDLGALPAV